MFWFADLEYVFIFRDKKLSTRGVIMYQLYVVKPAFWQQVYTQYLEEQNATNWTKGDLNVTIYQCHQFSSR